MRRFIFIAPLVLVVGMLAGCGSDTPADETVPTEEVVTTEAE